MVQLLDIFKARGPQQAIFAKCLHDSSCICAVLSPTNHYTSSKCLDEILPSDSEQPNTIRRPSAFLTAPVRLQDMHPFPVFQLVNLSIIEAFAARIRTILVSHESPRQ